MYDIHPITLAGVLLGVGFLGFAEVKDAGKPAEWTVKPTNNFDAELISTNREPVKLQSAQPDWATLPTNATAFTARLPVYVIPEMLVTVLPDGTRLMFIEQHHLAELAKKFRTVRYTNLVIYADGI